MSTGSSVRRSPNELRHGASTQDINNALGVHRTFQRMRDEAGLDPHATLADLIQVHRAQAAGEVLKVMQAHRAGDPDFLNVYGDD